MNMLKFEDIRKNANIRGIQTHEIVRVMQVEPIGKIALEKVEKLEIISEITSKRRGCIYAYKTYLGIMNEGTEPQ
jgi:hypothetical protein